MKTKILLILLFPSLLFAQNYNADKNALSFFLVRMYKNAPFDIKVVNDYDNTYIVSAVVLNPQKYSSESAMLRVASVKAISQASRYFNGSEISTDLFITTTEKSDGAMSTEIVEQIKEKSIGYVQQLEHLTNFEQNNDQKVFIYYKQME